MRILLFKMVLMSFCLILILMSVGKSDAKINPDSISALWLLDEGQGDIVRDSSQSRNNGKFSNSKGINWLNGKFSKALEFKGTDYVIIPNSKSLSMNDTISIALWTKLNALKNYPSLVYKGKCGVAGYWGIHQSPSGIVYARLDTSGGLNLNGGNIEGISDGSWHHIVFVFNKGEVKLFKDGEELPGKTYSHGNGFGSAEELGIGSGFYPQDPRDLDGAIDEVGIFNIALTKDDVKEIVTNGFKELFNIIAVRSSGKLATSWANLKIQ
ncbi:MAG: LamG domain-containing protein [Candidatus Poribacteria bacterium]